METIARGDLEKLTGSSGSPINHVYADRISGATAVLEACSCTEHQEGQSPAAAAFSCHIPLRMGLQAVNAWWFVKRGCSGAVELLGMM